MESDVFCFETVQGRVTVAKGGGGDWELAFGFSLVHGLIWIGSEIFLYCSRLLPCLVGFCVERCMPCASVSVETLSRTL